MGSLLLQPPHPRTLFSFELKLLQELGLQPHLHQVTLNPGTKQLVQLLAAEDWQALGRFKLSRSQVSELGQFLHGFLLYHLGRIPKGRDAALGPL
jgi:hypothetical protein